MMMGEGEGGGYVREFMHDVRRSRAEKNERNKQTREKQTNKTAFEPNKTACKNVPPLLFFASSHAGVMPVRKTDTLSIIPLLFSSRLARPLQNRSDGLGK